jgi:hypothetical protein
VKQLKHRGFIYNALNCLNKENKRLLIHAVLSVRESLKRVYMRCGAALQLQMFGGVAVWFFKNAVMKVWIFWD